MWVAVAICKGDLLERKQHIFQILWKGLPDSGLETHQMPVVLSCLVSACSYSISRHS